MVHMRHQGAQTADPRVDHKISQPHASRDRHAGHSVALFRDKFWLSFALTIPVVFWSVDVQHWLGYTAPSFPGSKFIPPVLGAVVFFYGGLVFIRGAWNELADHKPGMMTLISLAITVAFGTSLAATFGLFEIDKAIDAMYEKSSLSPPFQFCRKQRPCRRFIGAFHRHSRKSGRFIEGHNGIVFVERDKLQKTTISPILFSWSVTALAWKFLHC